jgi:streptomycin 6-kinase
MPGEWVVIVGTGPSDIYGPMSYDEANKLVSRLKSRARQMEELHKASSITARALSNPSNYQLDQIINNIAV